MSSSSCSVCLLEKENTLQDTALKALQFTITNHKKMTWEKMNMTLTKKRSCFRNIEIWSLRVLIIFKTKIKEELRIGIRTLCVLQKAKQNYRQIVFYSF